jgi:PKD repeat protein
MMTSRSTLQSAAALVVCLAVVLGGLHGAGVAVAQADESAIAVGSTPSSGDSGPVAGYPGEEVTVTVWANASDVRGYQATLSFDPSVVQVVSVSGSDDFAAPVSRVDNDTGIVEFNQLRSGGADDPVLARLTLELVSGAGSGTTLSFAESNTRLADSAPSEIDLATYDDTTVSVVAPTAVCDSCSEPTDPDGDRLYEDVDGDEQFTFFDVLTLYDYFQNADDPAVVPFDFDGNGQFTFFDVLSLYDEFQRP